MKLANMSLTLSIHPDNCAVLNGYKFWKWRYYAWDLCTFDL